MEFDIVPAGVVTCGEGAVIVLQRRKDRLESNAALGKNSRVVLVILLECCWQYDATTGLCSCCA